MHTVFLTKIFVAMAFMSSVQYQGGSIQAQTPNPPSGDLVLDTSIAEVKYENEEEEEEEDTNSLVNDD